MLPPSAIAKYHHVARVAQIARIALTIVFARSDSPSLATLPSRCDVCCPPSQSLYSFAARTLARRPALPSRSEILLLVIAAIRGCAPLIRLAVPLLVNDLTCQYAMCVCWQSLKKIVVRLQREYGVSGCAHTGVGRCCQCCCCCCLCCLCFCCMQRPAVCCLCRSRKRALRPRLTRPRCLPLLSPMSFAAAEASTVLVAVVVVPRLQFLRIARHGVPPPLPFLS